MVSASSPYRRKDYSAIEKRDDRVCFALLGRSTRGLAPRMNSTAHNATMAQMQRITVKTFISSSSLSRSALRLVRLLPLCSVRPVARAAGQCVVCCVSPSNRSSSISRVVSASCFSSDTRASSALTASPRATAECV